MDGKGRLEVTATPFPGTMKPGNGRSEFKPLVLYVGPAWKLYQKRQRSLVVVRPTERHVDPNMHRRMDAMVKLAMCPIFVFDKR